METVFTLAAGRIFFHEILSTHEYFGCALMFNAIVISQLSDKERTVKINP